MTSCRPGKVTFLDRGSFQPDAACDRVNTYPEHRPGSVDDKAVIRVAGAAQRYQTIHRWLADPILLAVQQWDIRTSGPYHASPKGGGGSSAGPRLRDWMRWPGNFSGAPGNTDIAPPHCQPDVVVAAAYGRSPDVTDDETLAAHQHRQGAAEGTGK